MKAMDDIEGELGSPAQQAPPNQEKASHIPA
jgi:hypothetical protein